MLDANTSRLDAYERKMEARDMDYSVILQSHTAEAKGIHTALGIVMDDLRNLMNAIGHDLEEYGFDSGVDTIEKAIGDMLGEDHDLVYLFEAVENML